MPPIMTEPHPGASSSPCPSRARRLHPAGHSLAVALVALVALVVLVAGGAGACGDSGAGVSDVIEDDIVEPAAPTGMLGDACRADDECVSGVCLESEYGPPFCTRACDSPQVDCALGDDVREGVRTLCISYEEEYLPYPELVDDFKGEMKTFCVPLCGDTEECREANRGWETCEAPQYLGNQLYPNLGGTKSCQSPSYQGKDPVDPSTCDYFNKLVRGSPYGSENSLCGFYCDYMDACKVLDVGADLNCCSWGCFNAMVVEGELDDNWYDRVKCYVDEHGSWPAVGTKNFCSEPPKNCGGEPEDPTPPSAGGPGL